MHSVSTTFILSRQLIVIFKAMSIALNHFPIIVQARDYTPSTFSNSTVSSLTMTYSMPIRNNNYRVFLHRMRRPFFFKYQKNYWSQNIVIGLIWKTVHWIMFSLNAIGLETKCLPEIVQSEKKIIFQFTRERIKLAKRFWHHSMCFFFQIMHSVSLNFTSMT